MLKRVFSTEVTASGQKAGILLQIQRYLLDLFCGRSSTCPCGEISDPLLYCGCPNSLILIIHPANLGLFAACWENLLPGLIQRRQRERFRWGGWVEMK